MTFSLPSSKSLRQRFKIISAGLLVMMLPACNSPLGSSATPTPSLSLLPDPPHLETLTLDHLFGSAGSFLQTAGDDELFTLSCTVIEGTFCWYGDRPQDGTVPSDLARQVIDQVGTNAIENANRNQVLIQCARPTAGGDPICEIDWGWGASWESLPID